MLRLKELRKAAKLSQQQLAKIVGVTQAALSGWENGKFQIDNESLYKLSAYFGVTVDYLLGLDDRCYPIPQLADVQNYIVGYIDFLGIKSMIDQGDIQLAIENLTSVYATIVQAINIANKNTKTVQMKVFSDNILFCVNYDVNESVEEYSSAIFLVSQCVAFVQLHALVNHNLILRGSICDGQLSINNTFVLGEALINSYEIECKKAVVPRVIISDKIIKKLNTTLVEWIDIDNDDRYYVNFFNAIDTVFCNTIDLTISKIAHNLKNFLKTNEDFHILSKYIWIYNKLYTFCKARNKTHLIESIIPNSYVENLKKSEKKCISDYSIKANEIFSLYDCLDDNDKAEIRGEMKQMLKSDKYNKKGTELQHA